MAQPTPVIPLNDPCSTIFNNTLYVYTAGGFQSLPLSKGGQWTSLPMGIQVTGAACVLGVPSGDSSQASMFIVGGQTNSSSANYPGLQRYIFAEQQWETCTPLVSVTQNRINHGAAYINSTSSILVYAGSQDGDDGLSSQTFLISTLPPYTVQAFSSSAPPAVAPILLPWDDNHAVMLGGDPQNTEVFLFSPDTGWQNLNVSLIQGLPPQSQVQAAIIDSDDGSKVLETFDMAVSPNNVTAIVLLGANGTPASPGETIGASASAVSGKRLKRALTLANWPQYNDTSAPTATRSGFSLAEDRTGLVVLTGGNDQEPISIFDTNQNAWVDSSELLGVQSSTSPTSASSASSASPATSSSVSPTVAAVGAASHHPRSTTILAGVLGGVLGFALLLGGVLLYLRWKRIRRARAAVAEERDHWGSKPGADKEIFEFLPQGNFGDSGRPHGDSIFSESSIGIIAGRIGKTPRAPLSPRPAGSVAVSRFNIDKDTMRSVAARPAAPSANAAQNAVVYGVGANEGPNSNQGPAKHRSSGWNRYFSTNSGGEVDDTARSTRTTFFTDQSQLSRSSRSYYTDSRAITSDPHESATVPPLNLGKYSSFQGAARRSEDPGSPTLGHAQVPGLAISDGLNIDRPRSGSISSMSSSSERGDYTGGGHGGLQEPSSWTPVDRPDWDRRPSSSVYTESARGTLLEPRVSTVTTFPVAASTTFPRGGRGVTVRDVESNEIPATNSDMSWLNLGISRG